MGARQQGPRAVPNFNVREAVATRPGASIVSRSPRARSIATRRRKIGCSAVLIAAVLL